MTAMNTLIVALSRQIGGARTIEEVDELGLAFAALAGTGLVSSDRMHDIGGQIDGRRKHVERVNSPPVIGPDTRYSILVPHRSAGQFGGTGWEFYKRGEPMLWDEVRKEREYLRTRGTTNIKIVLVLPE